MPFCLSPFGLEWRFGRFSAPLGGLWFCVLGCRQGCRKTVELVLGSRLGKNSGMWGFSLWLTVCRWDLQAIPSCLKELACSLQIRNVYRFCLNICTVIQQAVPLMCTRTGCPYWLVIAVEPDLLWSWSKNVSELFVVQIVRCRAHCQDIKIL